MDYAAESRQPEIVENLMHYFLNEGLKDCFSGLLYKCYELLRPDVVLELAWRHNIVDCAMPYMIQTIRDFGARVCAPDFVKYIMFLASQSLLF